MDKYRAYKYNMLTNNCNHFSNEFVKILYKDRVSIPNYINRAAWLGSWFMCCVPTKYVIVTPAGREEEAMALIKQFKAEEATEKDMSQSFRGSGTSLGTADSSSNDWSPTAVIDTFYTSLSFRSKKSEGDTTNTEIASDSDGDNQENENLV